MRQERKYYKSYRNYVIVGGLMILCLSVIYVGRPWGGMHDYSKGKIAGKWTSSLIGKVIYFGKDITDRLTISFSDYKPSQLVNASSSFPLAAQNFKKTRPRGIPAQEPTCKSVSLAGLVLIYPPDNSAFISITPFLILTISSGSAVNIRPPPDTMI